MDSLVAGGASKIPRVGSIRRGRGLDEPFDPVLVGGRLGEGAAHDAGVVRRPAGPDDLASTWARMPTRSCRSTASSITSPTESSSSARNARPPRDTSISRPSTTRRRRAPGSGDAPARTAAPARGPSGSAGVRRAARPSRAAYPSPGPRTRRYPRRLVRRAAPRRLRPRPGRAGRAEGAPPGLPRGRADRRSGARRAGRDRSGRPRPRTLGYEPVETGAILPPRWETYWLRVRAVTCRSGSPAPASTCASTSAGEATIWRGRRLAAGAERRRAPGSGARPCCWTGPRAASGSSCCSSWPAGRAWRSASAASSPSRPG